MIRWAVAIWILLAVCCGTVFGSGGQLVCVSYGDDPCGVTQVDACCGEPLDQDCPPSENGDDCCFEVLLPTAVETVAQRAPSSRDADPLLHGTVPIAILPAPPTDRAGSPHLRRYTFRSGLPRDARAVVRTSRLLL